MLSPVQDATAEMPADVLHPTLLWEDPRCPARPGTSDERDRDLRVEGQVCRSGRDSTTWLPC